MEQIQAGEMQMYPPTELIDNTRRFPKVKWGQRTYLSLAQTVVQRVLTPPFNKAVITIYGGEPLSDKSRVQEQMFAITQGVISDWEGEDFRDSRTELVSCDVTWMKCVNAAKRMGLIPQHLTYGQWKSPHTEAITNLAQQAIAAVVNPEEPLFNDLQDKARMVRTDLVPTAYPISKDDQFTGAETKELGYVGLNRNLTTAKRLFADPATKDNTFFAAVVVSERIRAEGKALRTELTYADTNEEVRRVLQKYGIDPQNEEAVLLDLKLDGAPPPAINDIEHQSHRMWFLQAVSQKIWVPDIAPLESFEGFESYIRDNPKERTQIAGRGYWPAVVSDLEIPSAQGFIGYRGRKPEVLSLHYGVKQIDVPGRIADEWSRRTKVF